MKMNEYIVYVRLLRNKRLVIGKMRLAAFNAAADPTGNDLGGKLIYFELKKNMRAAVLIENKFRSLTRNKLMDKIRNINPELFDLKQTINNNINYLKELIN
jgi:hypothetical protein